MANFLLDGTVMPGHLSCPSIPTYDNGQAFSNIELRLGEVQNIIYPNDPKSISKSIVEYNVFVQHRANGTAATRMYQNCILINPIASLADKAFWTLRTSDSATKQGANGLGLGSKVLILCVNGETNNAIIVGGVRDQKDTDDLNAKALGHHLEFIFNGIKFFINNDGELNVNYGGKTSADGKTNVSDSSRNTNLSFLKDGTFNVKTDDGNGSTEQSIEINHTNKSINLKAKEHWNVDVSGNISINADAICEIKTAGVKLGNATDSMMLGTTYRNSESTLHATMQSGLTALAAQIGLAGASLTTAGSFPVYAGPAQAGVAAAGAALTTAVANITAMIIALSTFESSGALFLSTKNSLDF